METCDRRIHRGTNNEIQPRLVALTLNIFTGQIRKLLLKVLRDMSFLNKMMLSMKTIGIETDVNYNHL